MSEKMAALDVLRGLMLDESQGGAVRVSAARAVLAAEQDAAGTQSSLAKLDELLEEYRREFSEGDQG
uniref:Uncharacterized protein n=1 Tax=uncultured prokaryote TaxID=198431 RepID=A0A0H5Q367_9ZZZZ|nr:hypothetical protein [uncultured prokaryote]